MEDHIRSIIVFELTDNTVNKMWAKSEASENFHRVHLSPKNAEDLIKVLQLTVSQSQVVLKPRRTVIEKGKDIGLW